MFWTECFGALRVTPAPLVFEMSRSLHFNAIGEAVTVAFEDVANGQLSEAWRIKRDVAGDRAIAPCRVEEW